MQHPQSRVSIDFAAVNRCALACLPAILRRLLPDGRMSGREWIARNPTRSDHSPGSFSINISSGKWSDFAVAASGGDPVSLVAYLENTSQVEAARLLAKMLGLDAEGKASRRG
ncbi:hypothetical protein [Methylocella sp.]|uniref:hypothetical protein n=1 Tax=Methylocella sp. TaxID=1978226 RepID=UPI003783023C